MLTNPRKTHEATGSQYRYEVASGVKIYQGALVVLDDGYAKPGGAIAGAIAVGRAQESVDNTGGADGDAHINVLRGTFHYKNDPANPITRASLGKECFVLDDETLTSTNGGNNPVAGVVRILDARGVFVEI